MKIKYRKNKTFLIIPIFVIFLGVFLLPQTAYFAYITENEIIKLTNLERDKSGAGELKRNILLEQAAQKKGEAILKNQVFKHNFDNRQFSDWVKEENYEYAYVGENLAIDFATNIGVIKAWLNSPSHKKNLLNKNFTEIGVAIVEGKFRGENTTLVIQIFGSPLNSFSVNTSQESSVIEKYSLSKEDSIQPGQIQNIYSEQENNLYQLLGDQKLLYKNFNPISDNNIRITIYVTIFYSLILLAIYLIKKWQKKDSTSSPIYN